MLCMFSFVYFPLLFLWWGVCSNHPLLSVFLLNFTSSLHILCTSSLSDTYFANVFSHSVYFHSFNTDLCTFSQQKNLILMKCTLFLSFMVCAFCVLRELCLTQRSQMFSHMFSFSYFIVSGFTFMSMVHLENFCM